MQQNPFEPEDLRRPAVNDRKRDASCLSDPGEEAETLSVRIGRLSAFSRGRLGEVIDDAIERALYERSAGSPGILAAQSADALLSDQLFRARLVGVRRLAIALPSLVPIANLHATLCSDDSETLLFWARATRERPVELDLDATSSSLWAHVAPIPLRLALEPACARSAPPPMTVAPLSPAESKPEPEPPTLPRQAAPPSPVPLAPVATESPWRSHTLALTAARGPQPLAALERLFTASYLPLDTALHDPSMPSDARAIHARDDFRANFSKVYLEAIHSFAVTGKRPKMVLDAPALAARIARQTSARTSQILLVDSLRYDLGVLVRDVLVDTLAGRATLTNEHLLWSALPTTTTHQLSTLTHGVAALDTVAEEEREDGAVRGRTAQTIRRVKIGSRDVYRLDLCDVRVREAGDKVLPLLPSIASDVGAAVAKHALTLAPRTLLLVFGDHGFTLAKDGAAASGGSSPEEVLVPAFAFLVAESH